MRYPGEPLRPWVVGAFFTVLFLAGVLLHRDYGVPWDEGMSREYGIALWNFVFNGDRSLFLSDERYHGPLVEFILAAVEKLSGAGEWRDVIFVRRAANFGIFFAAVAAFYRLGLIYFSRWQSALLGCALLVLHPRIFANAFYNSKDMGFAALFIIAVWTLERYRSNPSAVRILIHSAATAAAVCARLPGILMVVITVLVGLADLWHTSPKRVRAGHLIIYLTAAAAATLLLWPTLWQGPIEEFMAALRKMAHNQPDPGALFQGVFYVAQEQPRNYLPVWIVISTPPAFLALLAIGSVTAFHRAITDTSGFELRRSKHLTYTLWLYGPIVYYMFSDSYIYDGWRHYYFLYPALVLWMVRGWEEARTFLCERRRTMWMLCALILVPPAIFIARAHPHEHAYLNLFAGSREAIQRRYDIDYWGLSYRQALEYVLNKNPEGIISIGATDPPGKLNILFLEPKDRSRIVQKRRFSETKYYLTNMRRFSAEHHHHDDGPEGYVLEHMIKAVDIPVMAIYRNQDPKHGAADE